MITYSYKIRQLSTQTVDEIEKVVTHIHLDYIGTNENGEKIKCESVIPFNVKDIIMESPGTGNTITIPAQFDPSNYTPFNQLTEAQVISWINANLPASTITNFQNYITNEFNKSSANNTSHLPWNSD